VLARKQHRVLAIDGSFADAHYNLGVLREKRGDDKGALRHFNAYRRLQRAHGPLAIDLGGGGDDQREGRQLEDRGVQRHPHQRLSPDPDPQFGTDGFALDQRQVQHSARHLLEQVGGIIAGHSQTDARVTAREGPEDLRKMHGRNVFRRAEPHLTLKITFAQGRDDFVVQSQQSAGVRQQGRPFGRQGDAPGAAIQQRRTKLVLEPADLQADGGLGSTQHRCSAGETRRFNHGHEGAQQIEVEIDQAFRHIISIRYGNRNTNKLKSMERRGGRGLIFRGHSNRA
jgi:hypothetical protein